MHAVLGTSGAVNKMRKKSRRTRRMMMPLKVVDTEKGC